MFIKLKLSHNFDAQLDEVQFPFIFFIWVWNFNKNFRSDGAEIKAAETEIKKKIDVNISDLEQNSWIWYNLKKWTLDAWSFEDENVLFSAPWHLFFSNTHFMLIENILKSQTIGWFYFDAAMPISIPWGIDLYMTMTYIIFHPYQNSTPDPADLPNFKFSVTTHLCKCYMIYSYNFIL